MYAEVFMAQNMHNPKINGFIKLTKSFSCFNGLEGPFLHCLMLFLPPYLRYVTSIEFVCLDALAMDEVWPHYGTMQLGSIATD